MKKLFFAILTLSVVAACSSSAKEDEVQEEKIELGEAYGPAKVDIEKAISVQEFFEDFEQKDGPEEYTIEGDIVNVCAKAGCWVGIDDGNGDYFMVKFKDHFTVPLDTKLNTGAYFHGEAIWDSIPVTQLREDAIAEGQTQEEADLITDPKFIFRFIADGIVLKQ